MDDKRLDRLYDYTKFHIGIYLASAGGLGTLISISAEGNEKQSYITSLIGAHWALGVSFVFMVFAGVAGAIVATSVIESETYSEFIRSRQGAFGIMPFNGKTWVSLEHASFWLSLVFLAVGAFSAKAVLDWI